MKCGVKGCGKEAIDTFDHWAFELDLCEDGLRHIRAARMVVSFAQGHVVTKKEWEAHLKPEAIERLFSPWERSREEVEESEESSDSELFVIEEIRDEIANHPEIQKLEKKRLSWRVKAPQDWCGICNPSNFPDSGIAEVVAETSEGDIVVGKASWETRFKIEQGALGKYIEAYPDKVEFKKKHKGEKVENEVGGDGKSCSRV